MQIPKATVCIPTYNRSAHLARAVDSVASQVVQGRHAVLVGDDASTDDTQDYLAGRCTADLISSFRNSANLGSQLNCLECVKRAQGDFVWVLGDDDQASPGTLELISTLTTRYPETDAWFVRRSLFGPDWNPLPRPSEPIGITKDMRFASGPEMIRAVPDMLWYLGYSSSMVIRREVYLDAAAMVMSRCKGPPVTPWLHQYILLQMLTTAGCGITSHVGVLTRVAPNEHFPRSDVWLDKACACFRFAQQLGYPNDVCEHHVSKVLKGGVRHFIRDKVAGRRSDTVLNLATSVGYSPLKLLCEQPIWVLSMMPAWAIRPIVGVYSLVRQ